MTQSDQILLFEFDYKITKMEHMMELLCPTQVLNPTKTQGIMPCMVERCGTADWSSGVPWRRKPGHLLRREEAR